MENDLHNISRRQFINGTVKAGAVLGTGLVGMSLSACSNIPTPDRSNVIDVVDMEKIEPDYQLLYTSLQGIVNAYHPRIYLMGVNGSEPQTKSTDKLWLSDIVPMKPQEISPTQMLSKYLKYINGLVVWDPAIAVHSQNVATTLSGANKLLPASPSMVDGSQLKKYALPIKRDLRSLRFSDGLQAYKWALQQMKSNNINVTGSPAWIGDILDTSTVRAALRDWIVATKGFAFELYPEKDGQLEFLTYLLGYFPHTSTIYGYLYYDDALYRKTGIAENEATSVSTISASNKALVATNTATNLSVYPSFPATAKRPLWSVTTSTVKPDTTYVAFGVSDGDNVSYNLQRLRATWWDDPNRGHFPMAFSISPWLHKLAPGAFAYYTSTMTDNENLIMGPSGAGYAYPSDMPDLAKYLRTTKSLMEETGLEAIWILDNNTILPSSTHIIDQYISELHPSAIIDLYGGFPSAQAFRPAVSVRRNTPILNSVRGMGISPTVNAIQTTANFEPAYPGNVKFVFVALDTWETTYETAIEIMKQLGAGYEVVNLATLCDLILKYV